MIVPVVLILDLIEFENACTSPYTPGKPGRAQPLPEETMPTSRTAPS